MGGKKSEGFLLLLVLMLIIVSGVFVSADDPESISCSSSCPFTSQEGRTIVSFNELIRSDGIPALAETAKKTVSLSPGLYDVWLYAYDGPKPRNYTQLHEQFKVILLDSGGSTIAQSGYTSDLADFQNFASVTEKVNSALSIPSGVVKVAGLHAFYPDISSPNSVVAGCVAFDKIPECEPDPVASDLKVSQVLGQCKINITAVITDECSAIEEAEYFLQTGGCGAPGTGEEMNAKDGAFNQLMELVWKNNVIATDGRFSVYVRGKAGGEWSNCISKSTDIDCFPPNCPTDVLLETEDWRDGTEEVLVCGENPKLSANICDSESRIQLAEYFVDVDDPVNWQGIYMDASDGAYNEDCEDVEDVIDISQLSEGTHYVKLHGKDGIENWGKFGFCPTASFIKDTTAPSTEKDIEFDDDISIPCQISSANGKTITDGCSYAKGAVITLSAEDPDPQQTGEFAGDVVIHYKVWYSSEDDCATATTWTLDQNGESEPDEDVEITLDEDSCHLVEYWAEDLCGNAEEHHFELDIIDSTEPNVTKTLGEPKVKCEEGENCDYYITGLTAITFDCNDQQPHPVGDETLYFRYYLEGQEPPEFLFEGDGALETIFMNEDSRHIIEWYCEDGLGNSAGSAENPFREIDIVESVPPIINKSITGPWFGNCPPENQYEIDDFVTEECYLDGVSEIEVNAYDPDPHAVGLDKCYWWYVFYNQSGEFRFPSSGVYSKFPIHFPEEGVHELHLKCKDRLGNEAYDIERFIVDKTPPVTTKTYTPDVISKELEVESDGGELKIFHWITSQTQITFSADDNGGVGGESNANGKTYYRITQMSVSDDDCSADCTFGEDDPSKEGFVEYTGPITINESSCHRIDFYSVDAVEKEEGKQIQCVFVDNEAPESEKEVGLPKYACEDGVDKCGPEGDWPAWYVNTTTPITLSCEDAEPHPVEDEKLCFAISWDEGEGISYITEKYCTGFGGTMENSHCCVEFEEEKSLEFHFLEESLHNIEWYCEDALGNVEEKQIEYDNVDDTPPTIIIHNPTSWEADNIERCVQSVVVQVFDLKSGVDESSVYAELYYGNGSAVPGHKVVLKKTIYGTFEALMDKQLPAGSYTLKVFAKDNLGNKAAAEIQETLVDAVFVEYINPGSCSVDPEEGGECDFTFHVCMRGDNSIKFWMNKLGGVVTPAMMNATVLKDENEAFVGLMHLENKPEEQCVGEGYIWYEGQCYYRTLAELLMLGEECEEINRRTEFDLHLNLEPETISQIGPGIHDLEYWIESYLEHECQSEAE
jgi:hypothetical protein